MLVVAALFAIAACEDKREMIPFGSDLVAVLTKDIGQKEINRFLDDAIFVGPASGEHWHRRGIGAITFVRVAGHGAYAIKFESDATPQERAANQGKGEARSIYLQGIRERGT